MRGASDIAIVGHLPVAAQGARMPTRERVQAFVAMVEANEYVEAIRQFYAEDATMQENLGAIRRGREALVAHEEATLRSVKITTRPGSTFAVDGDHAMVRWVFDIVLADGTFTLDEIAYQTWRGDRIAQERFYYDPALQRDRLPSTSRQRIVARPGFNFYENQAAAQ
jgi:ketosteroid isomerase-like protein